jgi:hypothetical protein
MDWRIDWRLRAALVAFVMLVTLGALGCWMRH